MADRKALCLVSGNLEEINTADRLLLPGDPDFGLHAASKQYVDRRFSHALDTGEGVYSRLDLASVAVTAISQSMRLVYFTATKSFTTTQVRVIGGSTAAAATPTRCEIGLFEINAAGDGTRAALTANTTNLFATASSTYTPPWLASYNMVIGQRYALSWLIVTTVTAPTLTGMLLASTANVEAGLSPRVTGTIPTQTTTPASFLAGAVNPITARPYGVILP